MANKRELIKEFGPKIIEIYGEDELKFLKENFSGEELEKYIKQDHDSFKGMRNGGKVSKKVGGPVDRTIIKKPKKAGLKPKAKPPEMSREVRARERSRANLQSDFMDEKQRLRKKFSGRGTSGSAQFRKEIAELESKMQKKFDIDKDLAKKYGKDAYKSRAFGVSPIADKNKSRKTMPKNRQGFVGRKSEEMKKKMKIKKPRFLHGVEAKIGRMRGGGLARSGSASLSGYKVR